MFNGAKVTGVTCRDQAGVYKNAGMQSSFLFLFF